MPDELSATIYVEPGEEITSIIDRLKQEKAENVTIVVPKGAAIIQSVVNLKLLKRHADVSKKQISIATTDRIGRNLASKANIITQKRPGGKQEPPLQIIEESAQPRKSPHHDLNIKRYQPENITPETHSPNHIGIGDILETETLSTQVQRRKNSNLDDKIEKNSQSLSELQSKKHQKRAFHIPKIGITIIIILFCAILGTGIVLAITILPRAEVHATAAGGSISKQINAVASTSEQEVNTEAATLPATLIEIEKEQTASFEATGITQVEDFAQGTITVYNTFDSETQTLVSGTRFLSAEGRVFTTTTGVNVPGFTRVNGEDKPGVATVKVKAVESGEASNVPAGKFTIPGFQGTAKYNAIYGETSQPMTGGAIRDAVVVSADDLTRAEETLQKSTLAEVQGELERSSEGYQFNEKGTSGSKTFTTTAKKGDEVASFEGTYKIKQKAIVYKSEDVQAIIDQGFQSITPEAQQVLKDTIRQDIIVSDISVSDERIELSIAMSAKTIAIADIENIKKGLEGKNEQKAKDFLRQQSSLKDPSIQLWPFWVRTVPKDEARISVSLDTNEE